MQESSLQEKIELLIAQLEEEVRKLAFFHQTELNCLREINASDLCNLKDQFEQRITLVNHEYQSRIINLEDEINYLKELNSSQQLMMEDNLIYIKGLEKKLKAIPSQD